MKSNVAVFVRCISGEYRGPSGVSVLTTEPRPSAGWSQKLLGWPLQEQ